MLIHCVLLAFLNLMVEGPLLAERIEGAPTVLIELEAWVAESLAEREALAEAGPDDHQDRGERALPRATGTSGAPSPSLAGLAPPPSPPSPPATSPELSPAPPSPLGRAFLPSPGTAPTWHLLSVPLQPDDVDPAVLLPTVAADGDLAYTYDACDTSDPWRLYDPSDPAASDLDAIDHRIGFWLRATSPDPLAVPGVEPAETTLQLCAGWNLVGYPLAQDRPVGAALSSILGRFQRVYGWEPSDVEEPWKIYDVDLPAWANTLDTLRRGRGYWVYATEDTALTLRNVGPPPEVVISSPTDTSAVTTFTAVVGTVRSDLLRGWELAYRLQGETLPFTVFATGETPVIEDVLAVFDPTMLLNGLYEIQLTATDFQGQSATVAIDVVVEGDLKLGPFVLPLLDLEVPLLGLPIQLVRTYDSRDKRKRDFGIGWRLSLSDVRVQENGAAGLGWTGTRSGLGVFQQYCIVSNRSHIVSVALPDDTVLRFQPVAEPPCQLFAPQRVMDIRYQELTFSGSTLEALDHSDRALVVGSFPGPVELWDEDTVIPYDPDRYRLTLADGRSLVVDQRDGMQSLTDSNGNALTFGRDGIRHSTGIGIEFERDSEDRIRQITDPVGNTLLYSYDAAGDLVGLTDQEGQLTRYTYRDNHYLHKIIRPDGTEVLANEFDGDGRLIRNCDRGNNCAQLIHNLEDGIETTIDASGVPVDYRYDEVGNLLSFSDALGNTTRAEYDTNGFPAKLIDPLGNETLYGFDARGNLLTVVTPHDPDEPDEDYTTTHTYDGRNQITSVTFPTGARLAATYDARGNLSEIRDDAGNILLGFTHDASGAVLSATGPFATELYQDIHPSGEPQTIIDANGETLNASYDALGSLLSLTAPEGTATFTYDGMGRAVRDDYANGLWLERGYTFDDDLWTETRSPTMGTVERKVDVTGRLRGWEVEDVGTLALSYDPAGRAKLSVDPLGRPTSYSYDPAGRLETVTDPNGAETRFRLDAAGRVIETTDALGHVSESTYGSDGRPETFTDPNDHVWRFESTPTSTTVIDPLDRATIVELSPYGVPTKIIHPDGSFEERTHLLQSPLVDASAFPTSVRDEGGHLRSYTYNDSGQLETATNLAGASFSYDWDGPDLLSLSNPLAEVVAFTYDDFGNVETLSFPDGGVERREYGPTNLLERLVRPSGLSVDFSYDPAGRVESRVPSSGAAEGFTWNANAFLEATTDPTGTTLYEYDELDNLKKITYPGGGFLELERDLLGRVRFQRFQTSPGAPLHVTEYVYDPVGNLVRMVDPLGGETTFDHDAANRLASRRLPNGVVTNYTYDLRDQVTSIRHLRADGTVLAAATYERQGIGEPTRITREDGSFVTLAYDPALRLEQEVHHSADGSVTETIDYTYDAAGNRQTRVTTATGAPESSSYTYLPGDRLAAVSGGGDDQSFTWDADGRVASISRDGVALDLEYDSEDQLLAVRGTGGEALVTYTYDAVGRRVGSTGPAGDRDFLVAPVLGEGLESTHAVTDAAGVLQAAYVYAGEVPMMRFGGSGPIYYLTDAMGSVLALADDGGQGVARFDYDGFGRLREASGAAAPPPSGTGGDFRFHGGWREQTTGLYHHRARDYDPRVGRFLSRDPAEPNLHLPESMHPYVFANGNPHVYRDPNGEFSIMSVNISMSIQNIISSIKLVALQQIRRWVIDELGEAVTNLLLQAIFKIMFTSATGVNPFTTGIEAWKAGMKFQETLTNIICDVMGDAGSSIFWFDTVIAPATGKPKQNGFQCGPGKKGINADLGDKKPDFLLKKGPPVNTRKKAFVIGDIKISVKTFYNAYLGKKSNRGQWEAMYNHARKYQYPPWAVVFVAFHKGKNWHWKRLTQEAVGRRVGLVIFSFG